MDVVHEHELAQELPLVFIGRAHHVLHQSWPVPRLLTSLGFDHCGTGDGRHDHHEFGRDLQSLELLILPGKVLGTAGKFPCPQNSLADLIGVPLTLRRIPEVQLSVRHHGFAERPAKL
jgi:hypothetical protein